MTNTLYVKKFQQNKRIQPRYNAVPLFLVGARIAVLIIQYQVIRSDRFTRGQSIDTAGSAYSFTMVRAVGRVFSMPRALNKRRV